MSDMDSAEIDEPDGLDSEQSTRFHKGAPIQDGPFTLAYNRDGERRYYLEYSGEVHNWSYAFKWVVVSDRNYTNFHLWKHRNTGFFIQDIENYPLLRKALITLARTTGENDE